MKVLRSKLTDDAIARFDTVLELLDDGSEFEVSFDDELDMDVAREYAKSRGYLVIAQNELAQTIIFVRDQPN